MWQLKLDASGVWGDVLGNEARRQRKSGLRAVESRQQSSVGAAPAPVFAPPPPPPPSPTPGPAAGPGPAQSAYGAAATSTPSPQDLVNWGVYSEVRCGYFIPIERLARRTQLLLAELPDRNTHKEVSR